MRLITLLILGIIAVLLFNSNLLEKVETAIIRELRRRRK